jgi:F-type H+-transporting ATPase subunit delta
VREPTLARRYAEALFLAARDRGEMDQVNDDVFGTLKIVEGDPRLQHLLESPEILTEDKEKVIRSVFGERAHPLVADLMLLMLHKQRVTYLPDVLDLFLQRVEEHRGIVKARVLTAVPLTEDLSDRLRQKLEAKTGKRVNLEQKVEPDLIGGATVILRDKILDGSLRHALEELRRHLLESAMPGIEVGKAQD